MKIDEDDMAMNTSIHRALANYFSGKWASGKPHEVMERGKSTNKIVIANRYEYYKRGSMKKLILVQIHRSAALV